MEKTIILKSLIIVRNTHLPKIKAAFIISAKDIDGKYYAASTDTRQVYEHFWNNALTNEQKVPAITHMLYQLEVENGGKFGYIQQTKPEDNGKEYGTGGGEHP
jgi:hypothetical protein